MQNLSRRGCGISVSRATVLTLGAVALGLFFAARAATAQQPRKVPRIGFLSSVPANSMPARVEAFRLGLRELGLVEGQTITIDWRWAEGRDDQLPGLAEELVRLQLDVIVTHGTPATFAARRATATIPIVIASADDPVATGLVESLARPGGNITGLTLISLDLSGKRVEMLKEVIPRLRRLAVLWNPRNPSSVRDLKETQVAARALGLQVQSLAVADPAGFAGAFSAMTRQRANGLIVNSDAMFTGRHALIVDHAMKSRLPAIFSTREFTEAGGLMSYGPNVADLWRRSATYVHKILKGAKPADLPVEQPTRFELVVNLKTAKALALTIPPSVMVRADQVIQ